MKKNYLIEISVFITFIAICVMALFVHGAKVAYGQANFGKQCQQIIDALNVQASNRIASGENVRIDADTLSVVDEANELAHKNLAASNKNYPTKFDLRNADLDGSGPKNYVTSVKFQNP